jgi:hypothetical protein
MTDDDRLRRPVTSFPWPVRVLATVRATGLPDAWVGTDVVFLDALDLSRDRDARPPVRSGRPGRRRLRVSRDRLARHRPAERWPGVRVIPPE